MVQRYANDILVVTNLVWSPKYSVSANRCNHIELSSGKLIVKLETDIVIAVLTRPGAMEKSIPESDGFANGNLERLPEPEPVAEDEVSWP